MHSVGVFDRTGEIAPLVEDLGSRLEGQLSVVVLDHKSALPTDVNLTFLIVGPQEGSGAALRKVRTYLSAHPATLAVACGVPAKLVDHKTLLASGIRHVGRTRPTMKQIVSLLSHAMQDLDTLSRSIDAIDTSADEPAEDVTSEPIDAPTEVHEVVADAVDSTAEAELETPVGEAFEEGDAPADVELDLAASVAADPDQWVSRDARLVTVASATGGCGKTFFATNLAMLAAKGGKRCLLVDLDLQFGEVATALRVEHPYSVYDGLYDSNGNHLPESALFDHLDELTHHHPLGFDVLTAPRDPSLADYVGARDATEILDAVIPLYDIVIVDTPPSLNDVVLVALDRSDVVAVMATLDVPSLKNLTIFLDTLRRLSIDDANVKLVLNKTEADVGMKVSQAQDAFNGRFIAAIPSSRAVSRSINSGTVVVATEPRSQVARKTTLAASLMLPDVISTSVSSREGWWRRWFKKGIPVTTVEQAS